jgi:hypothetical protein
MKSNRQREKTEVQRLRESAMGQNPFSAAQRNSRKFKAQLAEDDSTQQTQEPLSRSTFSRYRRRLGKYRGVLPRVSAVF